MAAQTKPTDPGYSGGSGPFTPPQDFPPKNGTGNSTQPTTSQTSPWGAAPGGAIANPGENPDQTYGRYAQDYHSQDRDALLQQLSGWTKAYETGTPYNGAPGSVAPQAPSNRDRVNQALAAVQSTDDPNYWYDVISKDPNGFGSAWDYWQGRINQGDGSIGVRNGTVQKFQDGPAVGSSGAGSGQSPLPSDATNQLYQTLLQRSGQSLQVSPEDPIIKGQTNAYNASQEQARRKYLSAEAEHGSPYGNMGAETRSAYETAGQNGSQFQATLMQNELTQRRQEIQDALTQTGSLLTDQQHLALQQQLALLDNALKQQSINSGNDQFAQTFGLNAADQAWYHDAVSRGLIGG